MSNYSLEEDDAPRCDAGQYYDGYLQTCADCRTTCEIDRQYCCINCPDFCNGGDSGTTPLLVAQRNNEFSNTQLHISSSPSFTPSALSATYETSSLLIIVCSTFTAFLVLVLILVIYLLIKSHKSSQHGADLDLSKPTIVVHSVKPQEISVDISNKKELSGTKKDSLKSSSIDSEASLLVGNLSKSEKEQSTSKKDSLKSSSIDSQAPLLVGSQSQSEMEQSSSKKNSFKSSSIDSQAPLLVDRQSQSEKEQSPSKKDSLKSSSIDSQAPLLGNRQSQSEKEESCSKKDSLKSSSIDSQVPLLLERQIRIQKAGTLTRGRAVVCPYI